jgi:hypothetical protein
MQLNPKASQAMVKNAGFKRYLSRANTNTSLNDTDRIIMSPLQTPNAGSSIDSCFSNSVTNDDATSTA